MDILNLVFIAILIALTAFFVTSEFAIVKIRSSRIDQLIEEGNKNAIAAKKVISNLDEYLSACQLGITITALGLGWLGEPTIEHLLRPVINSFGLPSSISHVISFSIAFAFITFLHVVVGELAPKTLAIQKAEAVTLLTTRPLIWFYRVMYPIIWALNGSARLLTSMFGLKPASEHELAHSEEELRIILSESYESGEINQSEFKYVNKIFEFDNRIAKEIMVPRTEIVSLSKDDTLEDFLQIVQEEKFTRYPIIDGDKDHIIGMVNIKEVMTDLIMNRDLSSSTLESYIRPIIRVIDSIPIHELLLKMQKERIHMAILMDEYGGTSGLVTVEDIIEEIVGEIRDEFDMDEVPMVRKTQEGQYIIDSKVLVGEVNDLLGTDINDEDVDTIGGWILTENYEAKQGDIIEHEKYLFKILDMEDHHIKYIEVTAVPETEVPAPAKEVPFTETEVVS
ncbi:HlyC/CorC family transporter [Bacillus firmus]|uniref:hemolysin family protein n=1 Tax=Cytobacillus firmus TaxID=1399 RepID=UPI0015804B91|nr:hemolysin family protein [Cytobacillus firmus]MBG9547839.1 membrane protein [Cytobacillus firmus]MBG9603448.1 membrane protein [Cytobacillus firmus]MED1939223.1 hemolysin family protein [Cytobacillus firmus]NUH85073.1 HlyC/CorC family transporter [Cytobacillus firmus]